MKEGYAWVTSKSGPVICEVRDAFEVVMERLGKVVDRIFFSHLSWCSSLLFYSPWHLSWLSVLSRFHGLPQGLSRQEIQKSQPLGLTFLHTYAGTLVDSPRLRSHPLHTPVEVLRLPVSSYDIPSFPLSPLFYWIQRKTSLTNEIKFSKELPVFRETKSKYNLFLFL